MDVWPGYCGEYTAPPTEKKGKGKAEDRRLESPWHYPIIDHGSLSAATLASQRKGKRYEWIYVAENKADYKLVPSDGPVEAFPPTRSKPRKGANVTVLQRAEQGAHFLRTFYPDVDIPTELIREKITEDDKSVQALKNNDVFSGNMMDVSSFHLSRKNVAYLAFPMGETKCQLNMSPLAVYSKTQIRLKSVATPVYTFDTPIRQIVASPHTKELSRGKQGPTLGVRTMGSANVFQVKVAVSRTSFAVEMIPIFNVQSADIGDRHAIDLAISPLNTSVAYVANEVGDIFRCSVAEDRTVIQSVHAAMQSDSVLCRIAPHRTREKILSIFGTYASLLDLRAGKQPHELFAVSRPGAEFTHIECPSDDHIVRLVSTDEILWLDERNTRKPLLAIRHGREFDRSLRIQTHLLTNTSLTFLTSRRNSLVTVFDVSRRNNNLVHMNGIPYALPPIIRPDGPHCGFAFYQQPTLIGSKHISMFQLSERGSVSLLNFNHLPFDSAYNGQVEPRRAEWPPEVGKLEDVADALHIDQGSLAARAHSVVDLQLAYQRMFVERDEDNLTVQFNIVSDTLDRMPTFWQDPGAPVEHVLTTFDIAMRSGPEPSDASRNDWFTGSSLDSAVGYRALTQGRVPRDKIARSAPWYQDISSYIHRHAPEFEGDPQKTIENLMHYDLADGPDRTADSFRFESEARSQLALDLSLASDVYCPHRPRKDAPAAFDDDMLSISLSTQAMSLGDLEPPPVRFGFLHPVCRNHLHSKSKDLDGEEEREDGPSKSITPLGVRLLLHEWEVGTDPDQYVYRDPYDDSLAAPSTAPLRKTEAPESRPATQGATQQRPPMVVSSIAHAPPMVPSATTHRPLMGAASQPTTSRKPHVAMQSQDFPFTQSQRPPNAGSQPTDTWGAPPSSQGIPPFASTQVLPGPHGGRLPAAKKKPRRLGGF